MKYVKSSPGVYDCHSKANEDEPMFVLLGRDPTAAIIVRIWTKLRCRIMKNITTEELDQLQDAIECADEMEKYAIKEGKIDAVTFLKNLSL